MNKEEIIALVDERIMNITNQSLEMLRHFAREHQHVISENTGAMSKGAQQTLLEARELVDSVDRESMLGEAAFIKKELSDTIEKATYLLGSLSEDINSIEKAAMNKARIKLIETMNRAFDKLEYDDYD